MLVSEENLNKSEVTLHGFSHKNEIGKSIRFDDTSGKKVNFDVFVRIKQALRKDEMENKTITTQSLGKVPLSFLAFEAQESKN